jgi:phage terminase large subunit
MLAQTPLRHYYDPRGNCKAVLTQRDPEILISGPAGTGKSRACLEKVHVLSMVNPGMRSLVVRKTQVSLTSTGMVTWKRDVVPESLQAGVLEYYGGSGVEPAQWRYKNGSVVVIGGMDRSSKIMSSEYDLIFVQEATELTEDDWEALTTRLRSGVLSYQQIMGDCNPSHEVHWLKKRTEKGQTTMLLSRHEDNPTLFTEDGELTPHGASYMSKLDALTGPRHARLRRGEWVSAEGVIYDEWDSAVNLVDRFDIPEDWERWWAVDFGYTNPFVLQCWAVDHDGRMFLYREMYFTQRTVDVHARKILDHVISHEQDDDHDEQSAITGWWKEPKPRTIVCDHDAEGRAVLARELGLGTVAADKRVDAGIQAVQRRIKKAEDGKPRLFIMRDSLVETDPSLVEASKPTCTADEIGGYVWDMALGKTPKEAPVKEDDHGMDAMRYMVMRLDNQVKTQVRFL